MNTNGERAMAWVAVIDQVSKHPNADSLDICSIGGWKVVSKLGEFKEGDFVVYLEIDSWVPDTVAPFLSKGKVPREYKGIKGERLKTIKLRGELSQGLILPLNILPEGNYFEKDDVSEILGVIKWEQDIPAQLAGKMKGNFPSWGKKTDQERCVSQDTVIQTDKGNLTIKDICSLLDKGEKIKALSFNHDKNILEYKTIKDKSIMTRKKGWLKIKTKSGKELIVTKNHKIWVEELKCYRQASDLVIGNQLIFV